MPSAERLVALPFAVSTEHAAFNSNHLIEHIESKFISLSTSKFWHEFKPLPLIVQLQCSLVPTNIYNVLPKGLKSPLMRLTHGLQVPDSLFEHIASAFQGLDLIFEPFY